MASLSGSDNGPIWLFGMLIGLPLAMAAGVAFVLGPLMLRAAVPASSAVGKWASFAALLVILACWRLFRSEIGLMAEPIDILLPVGWLVCLVSLWVFRRR